ncbi:MAG: ORF6N domain-containing protein [Methylobacillus sp.]|jgi:hypothetical protein|nr:ORF6N domain-containing protein [Methylobacillus sp.]
MTTTPSSVSSEHLASLILVVRGQKIFLGTDLAALYGVEHRALMQAVSRNIEHFPDDFMFQISEQEWRNLKSQFVTSSWGGIRKLPYAFTEQGVAMLSSVLPEKKKRGIGFLADQG